MHRTFTPTMYAQILKPTIDKTCALIGLIIAFPVMMILTILLVIINKGKPFYGQTRSGKNDSLFKIYKFKSMNDKRDNQGELLSDADRLTGFGKFIRKTSLDELPQLINILKGEMSFIGPRPLPPAYLSLYSDEHAKRSSVKPGISGWAQINGRNTISWNKKFDLDIWYVANQSFALDFKILWKTIVIVFKSEGVNAEGVATTVPYNGKN